MGLRYSMYGLKMHYSLKTDTLKFITKNEEAEEEDIRRFNRCAIRFWLNDENIEVVEHTAYPDPSVPLEALQAQAMAMGQDPMMVMQPMLHDVKIKVTETMGEIHVKNVPPENIMISVDTSSPSLYDSRFVQHRELMPRSEVAEMFDIDLDEVDSIIGDYRDTYQEESLMLVIFMTKNTTEHLIQT
jgi:hypothetical protein